MRILDRYLFQQTFIASALSVALFAFVLIAGNAVRDIIALLGAGQLNAGDFLYLLGLLIPYVVAYALPLGLLSGALIVLGRLSARGEITAMKAAGISVYRMLVPVLVLAVLGMGLSCFINLYYAPMARTAYKQELVNVVRHAPLRFIQPRTFIQTFPGYILYVGKKDGSVFSDFWIWELDEHDRVSMLIKAEQGIFGYDAGEDAITLTLNNGSGERHMQSDPENFVAASLPSFTFDESIISLSLSRIKALNDVDRKLSMYTFGELLDLRKELNEREAEKGPSPHLKRAQVALNLQINKSLALASSALAMAILGVPLGIKVRRSETYANFALALGLALVYYFLVVMVTWLERSPDLRPDLLVWLPNLLYFVTGWILLRRSNQN